MRNLSLRKRVIPLAACFLVWPVVAAQCANDGSQNRIVEEIRHELITLPYYTVFDNLNFHLAEGTITLLGQVTRPVLKRAAEKAVEQIEGIRRVDDRIEVLPPSKEDDRIRLAAFGATYGQPELSQYETLAVPPVHIIVKNGNITLEGTVETGMDKTQFFTQASSVPGVVSVTDHLQIAP